MTESVIKSKGHPAALWYFSSFVPLMTLAYGIINALLVLYIRHDLHESAKMGFALFAAYNAVLATLPILGGTFSAKFGYKTACVVGLLFCAAGSAIIALGFLWSLYLGLAVYAIGTAYFVPSMYCMVGLFYAKQDHRRESGFTFFYLVFNLGFAVAAVAGGYISQDISYSAAFIVASLANIVALIFFVALRDRLKPYEGRSMAAQTDFSVWQNALCLVLIAAVGIVICNVLFHYYQVNDLIMWALTIIAASVVVVMAVKQPTKIACFKILAFLLLSILSIGFWSLYMLEPSLVTVFIKNSVDRSILGFTIPAATFYGLDPAFILIFGFVFSWLWMFLSRRGKDLSLPTKFAISLIAMGLGYWVFVAGIHQAGGGHLVNMTWVVFAYFLLTTAELLISPIGLAMVGRLSPHKKEGFFMGVWLLFQGFSAVVSGYLAEMAIVPKHGTPAQDNPIYAHVFTHIGAGAVIVGIVAVVLIPVIKRLIADSSKTAVDLH